MHTKLLHGSAANRSDASRGLYICVYTAADAVPIARNPMPSLNEGRIVRGKEARVARLKEGLIELPKQPSRSLQLICNDCAAVIRFIVTLLEGSDDGCEGDFGKALCRKAERRGA